MFSHDWHHKPKEIARVEEGLSVFSISLLPPVYADDDLTLGFCVQFAVDETVDARFHSATVRFDFEGDDGKHLDVTHIFPHEQFGEETSVERTEVHGAAVKFSAGNEYAKVEADNQIEHCSAYTKKSSRRMMGSGEGTSTAMWSMKEDVGKAGRRGLETRYDMTVKLNTEHHATVRFKITTKAQLYSRLRNTTLKIEKWESLTRSDD